MGRFETGSLDYDSLTVSKKVEKHPSLSFSDESESSTGGGDSVIIEPVQ